MAYLEPAPGTLEDPLEEDLESSESARGLGALVTRAFRRAIRTLAYALGVDTSDRRHVRTIAQLLLFGLGVLLLCNGVGLLRPSITRSLLQGSWPVKAAPARAGRRNAQPHLSGQVQESAAPDTQTSPTKRRGILVSALRAMPRGTTSTAIGVRNANPSTVPNEADDLRPSPVDSNPSAAPPAPERIQSKAVPTRLVIPALGLDAPVVPVTPTIGSMLGRPVRTWEVPDGGALGWHTDSAPLGTTGNTVVNGHNTTGGEVFRYLHLVQLGDEVTVYAENERHRYTVSTIAVVREAGAPFERRLEHAQLLGASDDERLTLVTCHPYGSTVNRLIVTCLPRRDQAKGQVKE
ncbi:MAG: sortase [Anaerolineae bacterium]